MEDYNPNGPVVTEEECRAALGACLAKGWLQVVDEPARAKIADLLRVGGVIGPIYGGLPEVGCVDFTDAGADLSRCLRKRSFPGKGPPFAYTDVVHEKTAEYCRARAAAVAAAETAREGDFVVSVTGPSPIGPWRAQWWRRFSEGYRIDVEERRQWQGRASGGGENCCLNRPPEKADPQRLPHLLERHNVTFVEWVLLAAMERGPQRLKQAPPWWLADFADREFGTMVSDEEYRSGLESCLRYGWLRVVDQHVVDEIHVLLRNDPVFLAVPRTAENRPDGCCLDIDQLRQGKFVPLPMPAASRWGEIDFSPAGVTLYRMISAEWLGPDWEDGLSVSKGYYWEEHHYCEAEEGFQRIVQEHAAKGETIRASRIVPIGPWCVAWWERFAAGYRLELEMGDP
jgi:hypothetical protein